MYVIERKVGEAVQFCIEGKVVTLVVTHSNHKSVRLAIAGEGVKFTPIKDGKKFLPQGRTHQVRSVAPGSVLRKEGHDAR